ncbi:MAG: prepilin-type N-terminal cleavage/methylation domain-containing protein [Candidatus Magasanikbacteria bacterium]
MNKKGFTLIELLVVIAIIGVLSTLAVVALGSARQKANDAKRLSDVKQIQTALELFYTDQNSYPTSTNLVLGSATASSVCLDSSGFAATCTSPDASLYMGLVPADPDADKSYVYNSVNNGDSYTISVDLELGTGGFDAGFVTATESGMMQ